jgi:hypothetical protein
MGLPLEYQHDCQVTEKEMKVILLTLAKTRVFVLP